MENETLLKTLWEMRSESYQRFQSSLLPTIDPQTIIGVKIPDLRKLAKSLTQADTFLSDLPHRYFEENIIHSILLSSMCDFHQAIPHNQRFLPYIDNWSVCDTLLPKSFSSSKEQLLPLVYQWITSPHTYTCRFGIGVLMRHFLKEDFNV